MTSLRNKLLAAGACVVALSATPAFAGSVEEPGENAGLAAYAPLPTGGYFLNLGSWGVRDTAGHGGPNTGTGIDIPALVWSLPGKILGGKLEFLVAEPVVDVSVDHTTSIYGFYYPFVQPILAWDLGGGLSVGIGSGAYLAVCNDLTKAVAGCKTTLREDAGVYYVKNGWTLGATGSYGIAIGGADPANIAGHHDWAILNLTAYKSIGKWQVGLVGYGELDTNVGPVSGQHPQGLFAVGPLVGYDFGPVILQAKLTRDVTQQNYGGYQTTFWTNLVIPLWGGGAPPPPPPAPVPVAAPAPAPARTYLVFFDWDRADLTDRARQIVAEAAQASTHVQTTRIEVNGYTDTSGTAAYNQRLSVRRAESVASELVKDGVPRSEIAIMGFGETHLLVPTGNGVREPQNRRVEIILH